MAFDRMSRADASDHSPCVGHCTNDEDGFCLSCRRSGDELTHWRDGAARLRQAAWARIPAEIDKAGLDVMRLPLNPDDIAEIAIETLDEGGAWAVGMSGHWAYGHDLTVDDDGVLTAVSADGDTTITLDLSGKMRALAWARGDRALKDGVQNLPILIVVPRARIKDAPATSPTTLDDGRTDLGYGLPSLRVLDDGDDLVMESLLATARMANASAPPPHASALPQGASATPPDLTLPESYVLAAVLLPKGEAPLN
ncbi:MAG: DUF1289 domain-containing protein [Alphaproteobacteria bacterium]|nr:DUF1289 domain-containing protein [Alphaproteobacteria bacterium]